MNTITEKSCAMSKVLQQSFLPKEKSEKRKRPTMRDSIASTYNVINGTKLKAKNLKTQKLTEEQAIFAAAYNRISRLSVQSGRKFLWSVRKQWKLLREENGAHKLFKAVDKGMQKLVEAGKLTAEKGETALRYAVGRANLAGKVEVLRHGKVRVLSSLEKGGTYIDSVIQHMRNGRNATQEEMEKLRAHVYQTAQSEDYAAAPIEGIKALGLPSLKEIETAPSDMAWYPVFRNTGKAVLLIPDGYADEVNAVEIYDSASNLVKKLDAGEMTADGRRQFSAEVEGSELGKDLRLLLRFSDGTVLEENLGDGGAFVRWGYCF